MGKWSGIANDDSRDVITAAAVLSISEFEIFRLAYRNWFGRIPEENALGVFFGHYLQNQSVPMWVRAFTRRVKQLDAAGRLDVREFGLEPPSRANTRTILIGVMALLAMVVIVGLLVYSTHTGIDSALRGCQLPPCY